MTRVRPSQQLFFVTLVYMNEMTRTVQVMASSREVAERRALKRNPGALSIKR